jgi:hypothetical protein
VLPPRLAVVEIFVLLIVPALLEWLWPPFPDLTTFQPHPYWAVILILSLQYGTVSGLLTASIAIIATVVIGLPEADIGEKHFAYLIRVWTQPVLWIATAFLLGHFRMRQIEQRNELNRLVDELQRRSSTLAGYATGLQARCGALERRLATRPRSDVGLLLDTLAILPTAAPVDTETLLLKVIETALPGAVASVYIFDPTGDQNQPICVARTARDSGAFPLLEPTTPLVAAILNGEILSVMSGQHDRALAGVGVFAVPILQSSTFAMRRPTGILLIESLPSREIHRNTVQRLLVIAEAIGALQIGTDSKSKAPVANLIIQVEDKHQSGAEGLGVAIPEVKSWRKLRWLPASLRTDVGSSAELDTDNARPKNTQVAARR